MRKEIKKNQKMGIDECFIESIDSLESEIYVIKLIEFDGQIGVIGGEIGDF